MEIEIQETVLSRIGEAVEVTSIARDNSKQYQELSMQWSWDGNNYRMDIQGELNRRPEKLPEFLARMIIKEVQSIQNGSV